MYFRKSPVSDQLWFALMYCRSIQDLSNWCNQCRTVAGYWLFSKKDLPTGRLIVAFPGQRPVVLFSSRTNLASPCFCIFSHHKSTSTGSATFSRHGHIFLAVCSFKAQLVLGVAASTFRIGCCPKSQTFPDHTSYNVGPPHLIFDWL